MSTHYDASALLKPQPETLPNAASRVSESTPLLSRQDSSNGLDSEDISKMIMFWQEFRTIPAYTLPIFGSVIVDIPDMDTNERDCL